jgi:hypothetical protein
MSSKHTGLLSFLLILLPCIVQASTVLSLTSDELLLKSELIFQGYVVSSQGVEDAAGHISTHVTFTVSDVLKGAYDADMLELEFMGGIANGRIMQVGGLRIPAVGESGTFYVESLAGDLINPLLGWSQEKYLAPLVSPKPLALRQQQSLLLEVEHDTGAGVITDTSAFTLSGNYWSNGTAQIHAGMPGTSAGGMSWSQGLQDALNQWSNQTAFKFHVVNQYEDPCLNRGQGSTGARYVSAGFAATACGQAFGSKVLALTMLTGTCAKSDCSSGFVIDSAIIVFNSNEQWDIYTGPRRPGSIDFGRVALHELGHALGLGHEGVKSAIMQPNVTDTFTLQADDINAANAIYGPVSTRDDQYSNVLASIYGINVVVPPGSEIGGAPRNVTLAGILESSDGVLEGRYIDLFQYTLGQDTRIDVRMESSEMDPLLYVIRMDSAQRHIPAETFIDDNSGGERNARVEKNLAAGTYWIGASTSVPGRRGGYSLSFSTGTGTGTTFAGYVSKYGIPVQVNPNPYLSGRLESSDKLYLGKPIDLYEFTLKDAVTLQIDLSSAAVDTMLYVARVLQNQDLDSTMFFQDNDGGGGTNSRLRKSLLPGTYWIGASSAAVNATGDYQINVWVLP